MKSRTETVHGRGIYIESSRQVPLSGLYSGHRGPLIHFNGLACKVGGGSMCVLFLVRYR